jgi:site-specific DNA-cytosine methylase
MTSSKQTTLFTTETSTSSQADSHVNHSALQESEKAPMMNAILWHEMLRAIQQIQPTYVVAENVRGLLTIDGGLVFEQVCADLEAEGYEVQPILLPAAGVNAPHRRDRIFIVAFNTKSLRSATIRTKFAKRTMSPSEYAVTIGMLSEPTVFKAK